MRYKPPSFAADQLNAFVHFTSGMFVGFFTLAPAFLAPEKYFSVVQLLTWVIIGLIAVSLEYIAGMKQWRKPASGIYLSVALHFAFAITVIAMITFELWRARPESFISWFRANQFQFVTMLAIVRSVTAAFILTSKNTKQL